MGLACYAIKAYLEGLDHLRDWLQVDVLHLDPGDFNVYRFAGERGWELALELIPDRKPDLLCFSAYVWNFEWTVFFATQMKAVLPNVRTVLGGPEAYGRESVIAETPCFDVVVDGPGEVPMAMIAERLVGGERSLEGIPNVSWRDGDRLVHNRSGQHGFPEAADFPVLYDPALAKLEGTYLHYHAIRGCRGTCKYCVWNRSGARTKPIEVISQEIDRILNARPQGIFFSDADFLTDPTLSELILGKLEEHTKLWGEKAVKVNIFLSLETVNHDAVEWIMQNLNLDWIQLGIQSTNPGALKVLGREQQIEDLDSFQLRFPEATKYVAADLMYPIPGDTLEGLKTSLRWNLARGIQSFHLYPLQIFRGTALHRRADDLGVRYLPRPPYYVLETSTFPREDVLRARHLAYCINVLTGHRLPGATIPRALDALRARGQDLVELIEQFQRPEPICSLASMNAFVALLEEQSGVKIESDFWVTALPYRKPGEQWATGWPASWGGPETPRLLWDDSKPSESPVPRDADSDLGRWIRAPLTALGAEDVRAAPLEGGGARVLLTLGEARIAIMLLPPDAPPPFYREGDCFRVSYEGKHVPLQLVDRVIDRLFEHEKAVQRTLEAATA